MKQKMIYIHQVQRRKYLLNFQRLIHNFEIPSYGIETFEKLSDLTEAFYP